MIIFILTVLYLVTGIITSAMYIYITDEDNFLEATWICLTWPLQILKLLLIICFVLMSNLIIFVSNKIKRFRKR